MNIKPLHLAITLAATTASLISNPAIAQTPNQSTLPNQTFLIQSQEQQTQILQDKLIPNPSVLTADLRVRQVNQTEQAQTQPTQPTPCFPITHLGFSVLDTAHLPFAKQLEFALVDETTSKPTADLLGANGCFNLTDINALAMRIQNRLIDKGYVTTRVVLTDQNLTSGKLTVTLIPGLVGEVLVDSTDSKVPVYLASSPLLFNANLTSKPAILTTASLIKPDSLLNLRLLETTLENLKRTPSATAAFNITPSANDKVGFSDVLIDYKQTRRVRGSVSVDDAGSKATGRYQGAATLSFDNITSNNDLLYVNFSRDLGNRLNDYQGFDKPKGAKNIGIGYVLPIKSTLLQLNANRHSYHQTVAGVNQDYQYGGTASNVSATFSKLIYRDASSKTQVSVGGYYKAQDSDIDGTMIDVQTKKQAGFTLGLSHEKHFTANHHQNNHPSQHTLTTTLNYQRGTAAFGAITPAESAFGEGFDRTGIYTLGVNVNSRYQLAVDKSSKEPNQGNKTILPITYNLNLKAQFAEKPLTPSNKLAIGSRYTVRGFDGERSLSGDQGVIVRQEVSVYPNWMNANNTNKTTNSNNAIYLALDAGYIDNKLKEQDDLLLGKHLIGAAVGIKGQYTPNANNPHFNINYDIFAGRPIYQPTGFGKEDWVSGVSLGVGF